MSTDELYWSERYQKGHTQWDIGYPSTPIVEFFKTINDKDLTILIPGCGNAYEAAHLNDQGFNNVTIMDIAEQPLLDFKNRFTTFPDKYVLHADFFKHQGQYDIIVEQTFFSAIQPNRREEYLSKINELLSDDGILIGVLFGIPLNKDKPPYGGLLKDYKVLFSSILEIDTLELCYNSIPPRKNNELFIKMKKRFN